MQIYFGDKYVNQDNIITIMEQEVLNNGKSSAKHIFLIIMESLSDYHLSDEFKQAGMGSDLMELANSENGVNGVYMIMKALTLYLKVLIKTMINLHLI